MNSYSPSEKEGGSVPQDFEAYSIGPFCASVCSSLTPDETVARMNVMHPSGTRNGWMLSDDKTFRQGGPNPGPCERNPETHKHYLLNC